MKCLIFIILMFISLASFSQKPILPKGLPVVNNNGYSKIGYNRSDSAVLIGFRDTNFIPITGVGAIVVWQNKYWNWDLDSLKWNRIGNNIDLNQFLLKSDSTLYVTLTRLKDSTASVRALALLRLQIADTALMLTGYVRVQRFLDSLNAVRNSGVLSISATNGVSVSATTGNVNVNVDTTTRNAGIPNFGRVIYLADSISKRRIADSGFVTLNTDQSILSVKTFSPTVPIPAGNGANWYGLSNSPTFTYINGSPTVYGAGFFNPNAGSLSSQRVYSAYFGGRVLFDSTVFMRTSTTSSTATFASGNWTTIGLNANSYSSQGSTTALTLYQPTGNINNSILIRSSSRRISTASIFRGMEYQDSITLSAITSGYSSLRIRTVLDGAGFTGATRSLLVEPDLANVTDYRGIQTIVSAANGYAEYHSGTAPVYFGGTIQYVNPPAAALNDTAFVLRNTNTGNLVLSTRANVLNILGMSAGGGSATGVDSSFKTTSSTSSNTLSTAFSVPIQDGFIYDLQIRCLAKSSGTEGASFLVKAMVGNGGAGASILDGGLTNIIDPMVTTVFSSTSVSATTSGNNFLLQVTGPSATVANWKFTVTILKN